MAATVQIGEKNGTGGTFTDKTSGTVRFKNADNSTVDLVNPLVKPGTGTDFSYEKWLRLKVTGGSFSQISGQKVYSDGTSGFGTGVWCGAKAVTAFATPAEGTATTGYSDVFGYTSGSPLTLGTGTTTATGEFGDHAVLLMGVGTNATGGVLTAETLTFAWDEI